MADPGPRRSDNGSDNGSGVTVTVTDERAVRRAVKAAALGNAMEWFDFGIYSYLAATLGQVFFPSGNPTVQLLSSFATFAVAFLVRDDRLLGTGPAGLLPAGPGVLHRRSRRRRRRRNSHPVSGRDHLPFGSFLSARPRTRGRTEGNEPCR